MPQHHIEPTIGALIHDISRAFRRRFEDEARRHGLTLPQWRVLSELQRGGPQSQVVLAGAVDANPMTMSGILDRLEKRGLVTREQDPNDSRAKRAQLTDEGRALYHTAKSVGLELYGVAIDGLEPAHLAMLTDGLTRIRNNLSAMPAEQKEIA